MHRKRRKNQHSSACRTHRFQKTWTLPHNSNHPWVTPRRISYHLPSCTDHAHIYNIHGHGAGAWSPRSAWQCNSTIANKSKPSRKRRPANLQMARPRVQGRSGHEGIWRRARRGGRQCRESKGSSGCNSHTGIFFVLPLGTLTGRGSAVKQIVLRGTPNISVRK